MSQPPQTPQAFHQHQIIKPPSNGMAVTSLVLGIVAIVVGIWSFVPILGLIAAFFGFLPAVLAVIFGHVGVKNSKTSGVGKGAAVTGLVLGYVTLGVILLTVVLWIGAIAASTASLN
ncbi:DUF4190 domain-containing protein [Microbacterium sp. YY-01]|uniref:DUF4190 domain-containing protein n=1 Tax=Microbacterium sp. YY-01 TaxID=3421634 RepID=UPI003D16F0F2